MAVQQEIVSNTEPIRNKVAESGLVTLDLAPYIPTDGEVAVFDLKPFLFMEMILREKDYRAGLQAQDWSGFAGKHVGIICGVDAIIPAWAFMLAAAYLEPIAASVHFADAEAVKTALTAKGIDSINLEEYTGKRVVIKGCGDIAIPHAAYVAATVKLRPVVKSIMYGEPCSTVPIYKQPRA
jgi:hypothetical protein